MSIGSIIPSLRALFATSHFYGHNRQANVILNAVSTSDDILNVSLLGSIILLWPWLWLRFIILLPCARMIDETIQNETTCLMCQFQTPRCIPRRKFEGILFVAASLGLNLNEPWWMRHAFVPIQDRENSVAPFQLPFL